MVLDSRPSWRCNRFEMKDGAVFPADMAASTSSFAFSKAMSIVSTMPVKVRFSDSAKF